jgi:flagellar protein FliS
MIAQRMASAYRQTEVQSRTPLELVVMLYDGAVRFVYQMREAMVRGDVPARHQASARALAVIAELQNTLDMERGGAVAQQLDALYTYLSGRVLEATMRNETAPLDDAVRVLHTLRESWAAVAARPSADAERGAA